MMGFYFVVEIGWRTDRFDHGLEADEEKEDMNTTTPIRIAVLSGSMREDSYNASLVRFVGKFLNETAGVEIDEISLKELGLPIFSEEIEDHPECVGELKDRLIAADGVLISSPEYNGSLTGALKNAIDWASVGRDGDPPLACFKGKVGGLLSASPGTFGGLQGLKHVRQILTHLHMVVVPAEYALGVSHEAFDEAGNLKDEKAATMAKGVGLAVLEMTQALKRSKES